VNFALRPRPVLAAVTLLAILASAGCQENLSGGAACPQICPEQQLVIKDTTFVSRDLFDTAVTVPGIPALGTEPQVLVSDFVQSGGHIRTFGVFRFDTLQRFYLPPDTTKPPVPFVRIDSSSLFFSVLVAPSGQDTLFVNDSVTFLLYDVDVNATDFDTAATHARFNTPAIAGIKVSKDSVLGHQIKIPIDTGFVANHVRSGQRIRLGVRAFSNKNVKLNVLSQEGASLTTIASATTLRYFGYTPPGPDSVKVFISNTTRSGATVGPRVPALGDYTLVDIGSPPAPAGLLSAGGIPASRIFLRFKLPPSLVDSSTTIVLANLELHQAPDSEYLDNTDSLTITPRVVVASPLTTDLNQASVLLGDPTVFILRTVSTGPEKSGLVTVPLAAQSGALITYWRAEGPNAVQRAVVLQSTPESTDPRQLRFYGPDAQPDSLQPRMRVVYIPRSGFGLP